MRSVFISYAANDPDWPVDQVRDLATTLQQHGATVLLDQFHEDQAPEPSINEWREWMREGIYKANHILCLASPRYLKAADRDVDDPSGYGVAFESQRLIHQLYGNKGHNKGRIVVALRDGMLVEKVVPEDFRMDCPRYVVPKKRQKLLQDLTRPLLDELGRDSAVEAHEAAGPDCAACPSEQEPALDDLIRRQESFAVEHLEAAPTFFDALKADVRLRLPRLPWLAGDASGFVQGLCSADKDLAHKLMWAVRRVLKKPGPPAVDEATRQAAIAVYMLCACRWTRPAELKTGSGRIVRVPQMLLNPMAVLSATLFGGGIFLRQHDGNEPVAANVFEVRPVLGESPSGQLLRELYATLCPDDAAILDQARRDSTTEAEQRDMVSAIRVRINDIRHVEESSLTLVVDCPAVFEEAAWATELQLKAFARDPGLVEDLFVVSPGELHREIKEFWRTVAKDDRPALSARATDQTSPTP